jgi:hypothetical protein
MSDHTLQWLGLGRAVLAVERIRQRVLDDSPPQDLRAVFDYSINSSLPGIAGAIVRFFFIIGVRFLDIKKVAVLFSQGKPTHKTLLRKMYTVVIGLELAGIVTRTAAVSEIKLNLAGEIDERNVCRLSSILNSDEEVKRAEITERRRKEYQQISREIYWYSHRMPDRITMASEMRAVKA